MKNSLYVIAGLLVIMWAIIYFGFDSWTISSFEIVHILLIIAFCIVLVRIIFNKKLTGK
jgi:tryptophan-rich sensory protein